MTPTPGAGSTARARVNVALVKYWGKRDPALNLPATGSISLTLDGLDVEASARFGAGEADRLEIDGEPATGTEATRLARFLDVVRDTAGRRERAILTTRSGVPRGIGLLWALLGRSRPGSADRPARSPIAPPRGG